MTKIKNTDQLADEILLPLIEHANKTHGALAGLFKQFNHKLEKKVSPANFYRWLKLDPKERLQPSAGNFLRLCELWEEIRGKDVVNQKPQPLIYCLVNGHQANRSGIVCQRCGVSI